MDSTLQDSLISLRRIIRATESGARELAKRADMATSELLTLQSVADNPGISPGELAKSLSLSPVTSTVILQKLESRGLIEKIRSTVDKRRIEVVLTEKGKREVNDAPSSLQTRFANRFEQLQSWEQHLIASVLGRVTTLLGAEAIDASPILEFGEIDKPVK
ncbi:MAG: MarR family transcriptional regulator [Burkholderiales bacterium]|jgi:DNA-binding MarR family transcriptional regulator|uniref:MarR family winged helix-turn-helix transcriptional regulator n=1 Tax=Limnobacter sp. TaxID=2003368 RepID=UPI00394ECC6D|nr:MarR family transcriptional regulator [Burkholderiales bacterium]